MPRTLSRAQAYDVLSSMATGLAQVSCQLSAKRQDRPRSDSASPELVRGRSCDTLLQSQDHRFTC